MGINPNALRFLFYLKSIEVDFKQTEMIGLQAFNLSFNKFNSFITQEFSYKLNTIELKEIYNSSYCEDVLKFSGAESVHSFNYSDYESSTYVHDLNQPILRSFSLIFTPFNGHNLKKEQYS